MPVVDALAAEYGARVDFVAPAWKSSLAATRERAGELFTSGNIMWGLDEDEAIFAMYGVPYQPVTVLIASDRTVVETWPGMRSEGEIREAIQGLLEVSR
ncbi:MAG: TlpA family protein disulfide reductase [Acidimicrobiia bacterium]